VIGGCGDTTAPGDIGISLEEAKTLLSALQWQYVAAQAAEIIEKARRCDLCGSRQPIKDWSRRSVHTLFGRVRPSAATHRQAMSPTEIDAERRARRRIPGQSQNSVKYYLTDDQVSCLLCMGWQRNLRKL
jgi:hypothetical protein